MATFVLVHGAGHGGWAWRRLAPLLRGAGHDVYAPTLTGLGERAHLASEEVDMETHVTDVLNVLFFEDLRDVVLVGHSYGGVVITAAAHRDPSRIGRLVYLDAPVPADGESSAELLAPEHRDEHGQREPPPHQERMARLGITDPSDAAWVGERLRPQPPRPQRQRLRLANPAAAARPRTLIFCERSPENFPAARFRRRLDAAGGTSYIVIDEGHDAMLTAPEQVAGLLLPLAAS